MVNEHMNEKTPRPVQNSEEERELKNGRVKAKMNDLMRKFKPENIKKNYGLVIAVVLIVALILSKTVGQIKSALFGPPRDEREITEFLDLVPVRLYRVKRMDFKDSLPAMGRVEGYREVELHFQQSGVMESFNFEEGERILRGDIIASLDQRDALLKLRYSALELEKTKALYELGGVDKVALDQKELEYDSARRDLEKTNIYAPGDGYLGVSDMSPGAYVTPQHRVGMFVDFRRVWAQFNIIEEDAPKVKLGQSVEIYADAHPGRSFTGRVDTKSPLVEGRTRSQRVRVELDNREELLNPGMFVRAVINTYEQRNALIIPSGAFKREDNRFFVYVVSPEEEEIAEEDDRVTTFRPELGVVEKRQIEIEYLTHDMAEVGEGLQEGDMIISEVHQDFNDGDRVEIAEVQDTIF